MKNFIWKFDELRKDLSYDNVFYRRMIVVASVVVILWVFVGWLSDFSTLAWAVSGVIIISTFFFNVGLAMYSISFNKKDLNIAEDNEYIIKETINGLRLNNVMVEYSDMMKIVESEFKNAGPFNPNPMVNNGRFLFFVLQSSAVSSYEGAVKRWKNENISVIRIPLSYVVEADDCVNFVRQKATEYNIEYIYENTGVGLGKLLSKSWNEARTAALTKSCDYSSLETFQ